MPIPKINFIKDFNMLSSPSNSSSSSSSNSLAERIVPPKFYTEDDEICWALLLLYCDYHASNLTIPTMRNPGVSEIKRFFDQLASEQGGNSYLPYKIKNHLCFLTRALSEHNEKRWTFELAILIQDWFIDPVTNLLRAEIRDKFAAHFKKWPGLLQSSRLDKNVIDNSLCQAYGFMIFQGFFKIVKDEDTKFSLKSLCRLLAKADYCSPNGLNEIFDIPLEDKTKSAPRLTIPRLTMSFDRLSINPKGKKIKAQKPSNNSNHSTSSSLPFIALKY